MKSLIKIISILFIKFTLCQSVSPPILENCPFLSDHCHGSHICEDNKQIQYFDNGKCCCDLPEIVVDCAENEIFKNCASSCSGDFSCEAPVQHNLLCPAACIQGCFCIPGHVRNSEGRCIPIGECPKSECHENEEYSECGCMDNNCENRDHTINCITCQRGCYCKQGFVRNAENVCIPTEECPVCEKPFEQFTFCNKLCDKTCKNPRPEICPAACFPGCICQEGYVRDENGRCIQVEECPEIECCEGEVYSECGANGCQATCDDPDLPTRCRGNCIPGCICEPGSVKNSKGFCVKIDKCPIKEC